MITNRKRLWWTTSIALVACILFTAWAWDINFVRFKNNSAQTIPRAVLMIPDSIVVGDFRNIEPGAVAYAAYHGRTWHCCEIYCELPDGSRHRLTTDSSCWGFFSFISVVYEGNGRFNVDGKPAVPSMDSIEYIHPPP